MKLLSPDENVTSQEFPCNKSILGDLTVPSEIKFASTSDSTIISATEQTIYPQVRLFFSFDIVNSTMYKSMTSNWPKIMVGLWDDIQNKVRRMDVLSSSVLWRIIGDEMVFDLPIHSEDVLPEAVSAVFEVTQHISILLKTGKFFDTLQDQRLLQSEINVLKTHHTLSIKATAWIAVINDKHESLYDNIVLDYSTGSPNRSILEFLGRDIDIGFRLKEYTQDRRLCISLELAHFLVNTGKRDHLHILDYARLKGVWGEGLYPIIWYYNADIVRTCQKEITQHGEATPFAQSFRYDETDNNPIVKNYFQQRITGKRNSKDKKSFPTNSSEYSLAPSMYLADSAVRKIIADRNLLPKIEYFKKHFTSEHLLLSSEFSEIPLELHCAVVCCDVVNRKILIAHRCANHRSNPGKWEFGCAKANRKETLIPSIIEHYQKAFGVEIELVLDMSREEQQPIPIAVYEIQKSPDDINKGVIFVAKVIQSIDPDSFRPESSHDRIRWITESDLDSFPKNDVIPDFHSTIRTVFSNFELYFKEV